MFLSFSVYLMELVEKVTVCFFLSSFLPFPSFLHVKLIAGQANVCLSAYLSFDLSIYVSIKCRRLACLSFCLSMYVSMYVRI